MKDRIVILFGRDANGARRRVVRRMPRGSMMGGASAPWVWRTLQARGRAIADAR